MHINTFRDLIKHLYVMYIRIFDYEYLKKKQKNIQIMWNIEINALFLRPIFFLYRHGLTTKDGATAAIHFFRLFPWLTLKILLLNKILRVTNLQDPLTDLQRWHIDFKCIIIMCNNLLKYTNCLDKGSTTKCTYIFSDLANKLK